MRRWIVALVLGHLVASYALEMADRVINWDVYAACGSPPIVQTLAAPVRVLPLLIQFTLQRVDRTVLMVWWSVYLAPIALSCVFAARLHRRSLQRGFAPILNTPSDSGQARARTCRRAARGR